MNEVLTRQTSRGLPYRAGRNQARWRTIEALETEDSKRWRLKTRIVLIGSGLLPRVGAARQRTRFKGCKEMLAMHKFGIWAPEARKMSLKWRDQTLPMNAPNKRGWWTLEVPEAGCGDRYAFLLDDDPTTVSGSARFASAGWCARPL